MNRGLSVSESEVKICHLPALISSAQLLCLSDHIVTQRIKMLFFHVAHFMEKLEMGKCEIICPGSLASHELN